MSDQPRPSVDTDPIASPARFAPRPLRRLRRGDWVLMLFVVVLWGAISGSPLMRPRQSAAIDRPTPPDPRAAEPRPFDPLDLDDAMTAEESDATQKK